MEKGKSFDLATTVQILFDKICRIEAINELIIDNQAVILSKLGDKAYSEWMEEFNSSLKKIRARKALDLTRQYEGMPLGHPDDNAPSEGSDEIDISDLK